MRLTYKYRIYPSAIQRKALNAQFSFAKFLYNNALEERILYYKKYRKTLSHSMQISELKEVRFNFEEAQNMHSQVLQLILKQLDVAFKSFFRRLKAGETPGFPRFKGRNSKISLCFPQVAPQLDVKRGVYIEDEKLHVYGIDNGIKIILYRPWEGIVKQARILKNASDEYYLILSCDQVPENILPKTGKTLAIDLGLTNFVTTDDGTTFHHPLTSKQTLAAKQRKIQNKRDVQIKGSKSSNNLRKAQIAVAKEYQHQINIKADFQHKLAKKLIEDNDVIVAEDLNIKSMLEAKGFEVNKENIQKASWGSFLMLLAYKAERAGKQLILVNPKNTSKACSACQCINNGLTLQDREFRCPHCKFAMDRDQNAAINILHLGQIQMQKSLGTSDAGLQRPSEVLAI